MHWVETVRRSRQPATHDEFYRRVSMQAASLRDALTAGEFEGEFALGLELEGYAADSDGRLTTIPESVFETGCERELGRHNAEVNTPRAQFDQVGIEEQATSLDERLTAVRNALAAHDSQFITDGMWTIGPPEGTLPYLTAVREREGQRVSANLSPAARYYALDADISANGPVTLSLRGCRQSFASILVESLATSMQVHLQTPTAEFPRYFNTALRTAGPVLVLAANSPFLPPDLYTDPTPGTVLNAGVELRVPVFESMNVREPGKVRFPRDIDHPIDAVDRIAEDRQCAPYLREWVDDDSRDGFVDEHWELLHKQGTCWRWIRPVFGPEGPRIEYRVLAAQPSAADVISLQALVAGLIRGIVATDHPVSDLSWNAAYDSFYAAVRDGFDADIAWMTRDGNRTGNLELVYPELFALARHGLRTQGFEPERIEALLAPIEHRWSTRTSPSEWKREQVRARLEEGVDLPEAIEAMQHEYNERSRTSESFAAW
ncbi:hypothetical protein ACH9L7_02350 [Haloferax sp. S1W]|uniref:hypothetical protein n=1 Tax=Haloferax sp. S1W TaxID=3377110 RepID=UPI0037C546C8